jgi:L-fuculose-phosphate aldolase
MSLDEDTYKNMVVEAAKAIFAADLVDYGEGNVSVRVKKVDECYITPTKNDYATFSPEEVVHIKFDGTQISKGRPTSSEYRLHVAIYEARPKVNVVIHTHSPYASMLSVAKKELPVIFEEMVTFIGGPVHLAEYTPAGTGDLGAGALAAMGDTNACLMTNHGVVVCGRDVRGAVKAATLVEKMAKIYWGALALGNAEVVAEENYGKFLEYFKGLAATAPKKGKE